MAEGEENTHCFVSRGGGGISDTNTIKEEEESEAEFSSVLKMVEKKSDKRSDAMKLFR